MICYFKEKYNVKNPLVTCDRWIFEGSEHGGMLGDSKSVSHAEYRDFVKETYLRNIKMFSRYDLPFTIEMFSDEFFSAWNESQKLKDVFGREFSLGGPISFCYIDGTIHTSLQREILKIAISIWKEAVSCCLTIPLRLTLGEGL